MDDDLIAGGDSAGSGDAPDTSTPTPVAATETPVGTPPAPAEQDPAPAAEPAPVAAPAEAGEANEFAELYDKVEEETPAPAPVDPAAFDIATVPAALAPAFQVSEFIKSPENLIQAARAADEVWQVQTGKADASVMLEGVRKYNPERYASILGEVAQYIKWAAEHKQIDLSAYGLGGPTDPNAPPEDPSVKALRDEVTQMRTADQQRQTQEQRRAHFESERAHNEKFTTSLGTLAKGTFLDGDSDLLARVANQLEANKVDPAKFRADIAKGDTKALETAFKQVKNQTLDRVRAYNKNIRDHAQRLRNSTPAAPGQGGLPVGGNRGQGGPLPERSQFPDGPEGLSQWQVAHATASGLLK